MSKRIVIRLEDSLAAFVDDLVGTGAETSRAAAVSRALERDRRRRVAARDAEILAATGDDPDLSAIRAAFDLD